MSKPIIRRADEADAARLAALNIEFNGPECAWGASEPPAGAREVVLVAECDEVVVGFACLQVIKSTCYARPWAELTELYITPAFRGRGAGALLVCEAERHARDASASELLLRTNVRNVHAQRLFSRAGLTASESIVYRKPLLGDASGGTV